MHRLCTLADNRGVKACLLMPPYERCSTGDAIVDWEGRQLYMMDYRGFV